MCSSDLNKEILNNDNDNFLKSIDFEWKSKIAETSWKIGGLTNVMVNAKTMFQQEVLNPLHDKNGNKTYEAKIGLMYLSDYGFAALPQYWENSVTNYSVGETRRNNWLYLGVEEWTISRNASDEDEIRAYGIYWYSGGVVNAGVSSSPMVIRPTFYLKSDVKLTGGSGTESDPYRIA